MAELREVERRLLRSVYPGNSPSCKISILYGMLILLSWFFLSFFLEGSSLGWMAQRSKTQKNMVRYVIKRNGDKELFNGKKIFRAVELAGREAKIPEEQVTGLASAVFNRVTQELGDRETVPTKEIRRIVLDELEAREGRIAGAWLRYEKFKQKQNREI